MPLCPSEGGYLEHIKLVIMETPLIELRGKWPGAAGGRQGDHRPSRCTAGRPRSSAPGLGTHLNSHKLRLKTQPRISANRLTGIKTHPPTERTRRRAVSVQSPRGSWPVPLGRPRPRRHREGVRTEPGAGVSGNRCQRGIFLAERCGFQNFEPAVWMRFGSLNMCLKS